MKKSTLFFKVMVLLALLVPWAAWGEELTDPGLPSGANNSDIIGSRSMVLTTDGKIPGENSDTGKNIQLNVFNPKDGYNLNEWTFTGEVHPTDNGLGKNLVVHENGTQIQIKGKNNAPTVSSIYFQVQNSQGEKKWVVYGFLPAGTTEIGTLTVSYADEGNGSRPYNGEALTEDEVKNGLTVTATDTEGKPISDIEYTVSIPDNSVDAGEYTITVNVTGEYAGQTTGTTTFEITPKELTVTIKDQTKTLPGGKIETDASQWAEIKDKETAIISGDKVSLTGKIKEGEEGKLVADGDITTSNTNYTVKTVEPGTLTVKYELTDENWRQILEVTGEGEYTYDGNEHAATVTGKDGLDLSKCVEIVYRKKIEQGGTSIINGKPIDAGEYEIVVRASGECDNVSITGENKQITVGEITINKREITVTGSLTIKEGEPLENSYKFADIKDLKAEGIVSDEEETVKGAITITPEDKENPTASDDAFIITLAETVINYTISEESKIALVVEEDPDKWQEGEAVETIVVSVNSSNVITKSDKDDYKVLEGGALQISFDKGTLAGYKISKEENQPVVSGEVSQYFAWEAIGNSYDVLMVRGQDGAYNAIPNSVKIRITNEEKDGYIQINFVKDESTEEPGGDDEDMTWAEDGNKKASITVYVNAETGKVIKSEPAMESEGVIDLDKVNSELSGWAYATEDSKPIIVDEESISSVYTFVMDNENLVVGPTESFDAEGLPEAVKVKIENEENVGYLEVAFEKVIVIDPSDITAGGDDDNDDGVIDKNGNLFVLAGTEGEKTVYDSETHELAILKVNGLDEPLRVDEDYTVVYTPKESLVDNLPYHAGTYDVTIKLSDKYITTRGAKEFATTVEITKRDLHLAFSIEKKATIEDLNEKLDLADGLVSCTPNNLAPNDKLAGVITATFTIGQEPVDGLYPVYPETIHFENTADFDREDYNISYDYTDLEGGEHHVEITPDEGGDVEFGDGDGEIPADEPIGGIEYVDPETGEGSAGGYYEKKYRLYLAVKDKNSYYVEDAEADYAAEGLELFSLHDKKTTWVGGSFTVWYEHNKVANEGGYRVFIKRGKHADYEEVKLDEVSGYYQIRNVQSDIYVRLYFGTGFPVANEEISATEARAYSQAGKIVVITPEPTDVQIISMAGTVVANASVAGQQEFANLTEGVYIVRMGETVVKLQVRN